MREIEAKLSPLIANMFPTFYQEDGENFILFVKAYYEWLEQNHQLITLEDNTDFNVGDTIAQQDVTGTIISFIDGDMLVHIDGLETFKCFNVCSELIPVISSSGGSSLIVRGGSTKRLGTIFLARNLPNIRDIDKTVDIFILHFKEKYLKNIEFDIETNKELLVKNSLDLYRSKGTERSIDLFFRLIYGVKTEVYYPGDDIFRVSAAQWVKPRYIEISSSSVDRAIALVGKQITGVTSGATAFVERYIKRKIKNGFVHILYISSLAGDFINREILKSDLIYPDSPTVVGSLNAVDIINGSTLFQVGDIVNFNSERGDYGIARVASVSNRTGVVDFIFIDGGYGYTTSGDPDFSASELEKRTQSIVSEKVLTLSNVVTSNTVTSISVTTPGIGYNNTDVITVTSEYSNAAGIIETNGAGAITKVTVTDGGSGFFTLNPSVSIANSTGGASAGSSAVLVAEATVRDGYFEYFEPLTQLFATVVYNASTNNQLLIEGSQVHIGNSTVNTAFGKIISNANGALVDANGSMVISISNNGSFGTGNTVYITSNVAVTANVVSIANTSATSTVMGVPNAASFSIASIINGAFVRGEEVYQVIDGTEVANAIIVESTGTTTSGIITVDTLKGVFIQNHAINVRGDSVSANLFNQNLTVGVYNIANNFSNSFAPQIFTTNSGTIANAVAVSSGVGASFRVGTISEAEIIYLNTDLLSGNNVSNTPYMSLDLDAVQYAFPKNPTGNSAAIIFSCLNFDSFEIGTIASLTSINQGSDYNIDPYVLAYQPFIAGFDRKDYIITITDATGSFQLDERIQQTPTTLQKYALVVADETGFQVGEVVYQGIIGAETATGEVDSITPTANTITVKSVTGTFATTADLKSYLDAGLITNTISSTLEETTSTAKTILKSGNTSVLYTKRIQFDNLFVPGKTITGSRSGSTATIVGIEEDQATLAIGTNALIEANVATANGAVTSLEIIDSGSGYANGEVMLFTSQDGHRSGEAKGIVFSSGEGSGYYKTSKGFLSSLSKLHDGDYYQEYSYEVLSRIPLDRYSDMFKKVMHTAGTRFFGAVLLESEELVNVILVDSETLLSNATTVQFNSNTSVVSGAIVFDNSANTLNDGDKVTYFTQTSNTIIAQLANNSNYYIANATVTGVKLTTNPRILSESFNPNTAIAADFISLTRHSFADNDVVKYETATGNTVVTGLSNSAVYYIVSSNTSGVKLSLTRGGAANTLTSSSISENGHSLSITTINITANTTATGAATNGHFIATVNEI